MKNKIAMIVFSYYPNDPRVRREAEALVENKYEVDVFCLKRKEQFKNEIINNVNVYRFTLNKNRKQKLTYILKYFYFFIRLSIKINVIYFIKKYSIIHVHNMPDFLVFIPIIPKIFGSKIILDLHDPSPEVYMAKYNVTIDNKIVKLLVFIEKISIRFSNFVLTPNLSFMNLFLSRNCPINKIDIIMNSPDENIFKFRSDHYKTNIDNKSFLILYHGSIVERHGLLDAIKAIKLLSEDISNIEFHIFGEGDYSKKLISEIYTYKLTEYIKYHGYLEQEKLVPIILRADIGIIPNLRNSFTEINLPTRIFEYLALKTPVIVPKTQGILEYFSKESLIFFKSGDYKDLANQIKKYYLCPDLFNEIMQNGISIYENYRWNKQKQKLLEIIRFIIEDQ